MNDQDKRNTTEAIKRASFAIFLVALYLSAVCALADPTSEPFTRCLSSESGSFTQVDFRPAHDAGYIETRITVVLGYTDRWIKSKAMGVLTRYPYETSWSLYRLHVAAIESEQLMWFGISNIQEETGYNGFIYPGFLDVIFPSGEKKRFMLECHQMPGDFWKAEH